MAQQVEIAGVLFNDVPYIQCPDGNGVYHRFLDTTIPSNAAAASDIAQGKLAYVNGSLVAGTSSGGGGGGLVYETGTWTPASDASEHIISFTNTHSSVPINVIVSDIGSDLATSNSNMYFTLDNWYELSGYPVRQNATTSLYAAIRYAYKTSSGLTASGQNILYATGDSSSAYLNYWLTSSWAKVSSGSTSRYWRAGRTYKWIAVWKPTS